MQIFVKPLTENYITLDIESSNIIEDIKYKILEKKGIPAYQQRLVFNGKQLKDEKTLKESNIQEGSILNLVVKMKKKEVNDIEENPCSSRCPIF